MRIAIFGNTYRKEIIYPLEIILQFLSKNNVDILIYNQIHDFLKQSPLLNDLNYNLIEDGNFNADVALSVGGDGTFLNTAQHVGDKNIPILGINTGKLGFLADVAINEIETVLTDILKRNFTIEERSVLEVSASNNAFKGSPFALNEVAVLKQDLSSMISIEAFVGGEYFHTYRADGLIVSTPTGSTAYSLSVGGPILVPQARNLIVAPVASHSLNVRPLIIPDSWDVHLKMFSRSHSYLISLDGRSQIMSEQTELFIKRANHTIKIIKPSGNHTFFNTLKNKLMWGIDKRN
ncbi:MAG TPA: NAD kinase [Paludibacteraceae bacterium]|nr:MAG: putative inorganic polyphosphate/ATP-NAD kinase [Bacteroidetes bacterium ADurb.Bin057]HOG36112.1 NAD kinase [Paludibacteraceae bacterium]HOO24515.1 NAD kinase [Paludibacteraceae bacterium]HOS37846.1 NAD kinase [Paludibacteraceae bacterium]HPH73134.1 NAD kinase [Paludibacteraceae bacterium]